MVPVLFAPQAFAAEVQAVPYPVGFAGGDCGQVPVTVLPHAFGADVQVEGIIGAVHVITFGTQSPTGLQPQLQWPAKSISGPP
jgi:hypothetical protein